MKVVETLLNRSESLVFRELGSIAADNGMKVFAKTRLSDVIQKTGVLTQREFDYYTRSHCDFVVTNADHRPLMVVEYDGPLHRIEPKQQERDKIKNALCERAALGMLRINDKHVTQQYRGMTVLRWIVEVSELQKAFYEAQQNGMIPWDVDFDPSFIGSSDGKWRFPYWLSAPATQSFHDYFDTLKEDENKGWHGIIGYDAQGTAYRLSFLYVRDRVLWTRTAVRKQGLDFPAYDLLDHLSTCELGIMLSKFRSGQIGASSVEDFRATFDKFCERYNAQPSHSMGSFPFNTAWNPKTGWK